MARLRDPGRPAGAVARDFRRDDVRFMRGPLPTRLIVRSVTAFALRVAQILLPLHDGDVIELFTFAAIRSASRAAGDASAWDADAPTRTVSVSAVARSLGFPVETVRRRAIGLIERGYVVRAGSGLAADPAHEASPRMQAALHAIAAELDATLEGLARAGLDLAALAGAPPASGEAPPLPDAAVAGLATAFCLRGLEAFGAVFGDLSRGLLWCAVLHENTKALHASPELSWRYGHQDTPPPGQSAHARQRARGGGGLFRSVRNRPAAGQDADGA